MSPAAPLAASVVLRETARAVLGSPVVLAAWATLVLASLAVLGRDLRRHNRSLPSLMQAVWILTVAYSGPLGLAIYWWSGRSQIEGDSRWRRGARSTSHCYAGCGAGELVGITIAQGVLVLATSAVIAVTFGFAYTFGLALTIGPLRQDGVGLWTASVDAVLSETPSIAVMEAVAIGTDLLVAGEATMAEPLFWGALVFSLSVGFLAAYPVNLTLVSVGVKEGMSNPAAE